MAIPVFDKFVSAFGGLLFDPRLPRVEVGVSLSLSDSDHSGRVIDDVAGVTITLPAGLPDGFWCYIRRGGAGTASSLSGSGGATVNGATTVMDDGLVLIYKEGPTAFRSKSLKSGNGDVAGNQQDYVVNPDSPGITQGSFKIMYKRTYPAGTREISTMGLGLRNASFGTSSVGILVNDSAVFGNIYFTGTLSVTSNETQNFLLTRTALAFPTSDFDLLVLANYTGSVQAVMPDIYISEVMT